MGYRVERKGGTEMVTTVENLDLIVMEEGYVRLTRYKLDNTPIQREVRIREGHAPVPELTMEEPVDFNDEFQRKSLLTAMVKSMTKGECSKDSLYTAKSILEKELAKIVSDVYDELPFH